MYGIRLHDRFFYIKIHDEKEFDMTMTADQRLVSQFYENIGNKIKGHLVDIKDGPLVHNFIFEPDASAKIEPINDIIKNQKDVMAIMGKNITFQIPKEKRKLIYLKNLIKTKEFANTKAVLPMILGIDAMGKPKIEDLTKVPHLLVAGRTGSGKSVFIIGLIKSIISKLSPKECKFIIFDPRMADYARWNGEKHMLHNVVTDVEDGLKMFEHIMQMVDDRYKILRDNKVKNIMEYREKNKKKDMPHIVIIMDEFCDYMYVAKKQMEKFVETICTKARAVGIHLILGTQRPTSEVLSKTIKAFFPARISFQAHNVAESIQMLGERGAERLLPLADMLYSEAGRIPVRLHVAYVEC